MEGSKLFSKEQMDFLSEAYDVLYNRAQALLEEFNPCRIVNGKCMSESHNYRACCSSVCVHTSSEGCTTKNLRCKLFLCKDALDSKPELKARWKRLGGLMWRLEFRYAWQSKTRIMNNKRRLTTFHHNWDLKLLEDSNDY